MNENFYVSYPLVLNVFSVLQKVMVIEGLESRGNNFGPERPKNHKELLEDPQTIIIMPIGHN